MQAKIIEMKNDELYLEVDEQVRFRTRFVAPTELTNLSPADRISFDFVPGNHSLCIEVQSVFHPRSQANL
jgi:hypothetical protein